ncbi:MAG TPA: hypothetical protein VJ746_08505 [Nitrospira sp.]|nr:hypothetical protein [Nitrospira sp.]
MEAAAAPVRGDWAEAEQERDPKVEPAPEDAGWAADSEMWGLFPVVVDQWPQRPSHRLPPSTGSRAPQWQDPSSSLSDIVILVDSGWNWENP